jgi:broad specificity phosphatase PhoE
MRLLLVRHAESVATVENLTVGDNNCPGLTPRGFAQARELGERLDVRPDVLLSSPVTRARQTADALITALRPARTEIVNDLAEVDIDFASVTEWQFSGGWRLVSLNLNP